MGDLRTPSAERWVLPELLQPLGIESKDSKEEETDLGRGTGSGARTGTGNREGVDEGIQPDRGFTT